MSDKQSNVPGSERDYGLHHFIQEADDEDWEGGPPTEGEFIMSDALFTYLHHWMEAARYNTDIARAIRVKFKLHFNLDELEKLKKEYNYDESLALQDELN